MKLQDDLREELSTAGDPTFDDMQNGYPLLNAIMKEVLRLHPPILENHHEVSSDVFWTFDVILFIAPGC